jgi:molybdenum cofactor cytidylyltransferase
MRLSEALRLESACSLALVGAGGKTAALFQLADELPGPVVFLATTTHLAVPQAGRAQHHFIASTPIEIDQAMQVNLQGTVLFTGPDIGGGRLSGLPQEALDALFQAAQRCGAFLLIEADGSRRRPLKAPAAHEPVLPPWVELVVVVAGLSALGKPLDEDWVHRPERFAELSGLTPGNLIMAEGLVRVLTHAAGGLKDIPLEARRVVLLNQAEEPLRQSQAAGMSADLLDRYAQVVVAALQPPVPIEAGPALAVYERVVGIILAAGGSTRMGTPKQLLDWQGQPLVCHAVQTALQAGLKPVVVVVGAHGQAVRQALGDLDGRDLLIVDNPNWAAGQSTSVTAGLQALPDSSGAAVFLLCDQPMVTPGLVRSLVERHTETLASIVAPLVDGQRGNPVLFDRRTFPDLSALTGDTGGRALFARYPVNWLPWHDRSALADIDTLDDYRRMQEQS